LPANPALAGADSGHAELLRDSVTDFITRGTDIARVRRLRGTDPGFDRAVWRQMAEFGWLGILVAEEHGGLGLGFAEMRIVLEGLARVLAPEPVCAGAVLAGGVLRHAGNAAVVKELLPALAAGELIPALAWQEQTGNIDPGAAAVAARAFEGAYKLGGVKKFVHGAAGADGYIVSARSAEGLLLAWVPAGAGGVTLEQTPLADGRTMGTLKLADVIVPREQVIAEGAAAQQALERAFDETLVMTGAELSGVMRRALDMSLDYMRTREQFGKPIGSFQALAHRAVDLYIQRELASAVLDDAIAVLDSEAEPKRRAGIASRVKARASDAGLRVTREAIQIHGAIGFTDEYDIGLYLKRAMVLSAWLGNGALHRRRYAQLIPSDL
jgi:alkylation response protein AidB-like acyl-CoA dehydrogenase